MGGIYNRFAGRVSNECEIKRGKRRDFRYPTPNPVGLKPFKDITSERETIQSRCQSRLFPQVRFPKRPMSSRSSP